MGVHLKASNAGSHTLNNKKFSKYYSKVIIFKINNLVIFSSNAINY